MKIKCFALIPICLALMSCGDGAPTEPTKALEHAETLALKGPSASSCWSDAECAPDQNCYCSESDNGNCQSSGVCLPSKKSVPDEQEKAAIEQDKAILNCSNMSDLSYIPKGFHPTTARWGVSADGTRLNDMVCIAKTNTKEIRVLNWLNFKLPTGYRVLRTEEGVDTNFRGCITWSTWQGQRTCSKSWTLYVMTKN